MSKRSASRIFSLVTVWCLLASLALPVTGAAAPEGDTITISTVEDLQKFAKSCSLDTWSQGKTVTLTADLDLTGADFAPIPTFGGTFLGQGHTISGLCLTAAGSAQGLFRYIQPNGVVRDLTVEGTVSPEGTRSTVGGIVGDNAGTLQGCSFQGIVQGESMVGGVAGRNSESGQIIGCSASGLISGSSATGGIAGRNLGLLLKCENRAGVNLTQTESGLNLLDVDAGASLEELAAADDETYHLLSGYSDTGGIVGFSSGVVQSCTNSGAVGYPHVGYNTGGIAGRQNGYLAGCVNSGTVNGRKDVGGIVGQAEPYLVEDPGQDTLNRLRGELDTLDRLIDQALDHVQHTGDDISARLEAMGDLTDSARTSSREMLDRLSDFADGNIDTVNTLAADVTSALDKISPALDDLSDVGGRLERLSRQLGDALDSLDGAADVGDQAMRELRSALDDLRQSQTGLSTAAGELRQALDGLYQAVFPDGPGVPPVQPSPEDLEEARAGLRRAYDALQGAGEELNRALSGIQTALGRSDALSKKLGDALGDLQDMSSSSAAIGRLLRRAFDAIGDGVDILTRDGPAEFIPLGDGFRQASDGLYDALGGLSDEMAGLNDALHSENDTLTGDLRAINRQFNVVFDVLLDALSDLQDTSDEGIDSLIQDTSEEDIAATREGKVADCRSTGAVEGDRNVGGIVGAMAIELDLDPEDDTADLLSFGATYETKAVLEDCLNYGGVTAKKDCVGGLVGRMDLGTALDCQNYGPVASTGGDYVGGVAGWAEASIRSCFAKNTLSGGSYIGGIAGWASRLRDCYAIATITEGTECLGAVAGGVETDGVLRDNRFVDTGVAGLDGVSYAGRAEPIPFEELNQLSGVPPEFTAFTLKLVAGEEVVAQIPFLYGEDLSRIDLPPVPELEGSYGVWPEFDRSGLSSDVTVEAVYAPWVTLVASQELSGKLPLALAEGQFTEEAVLHVRPAALSSTAPTEGTLWDVDLTGTDLEQEGEVTLRLLNTTGGRAEVRRYQDGQWVPLDAETNGSYLIVTMQGPRGTFHIVPAQSAAWLVPAGAAGAAAVLLLALLIRRRKKAAKAAADKARKEQEETAAKS